MRPDIHLLHRFTHATCNFVDVIASHGKSKPRKTGSAEIALDCVLQLHAVAITAPAGHLSPELIQEFHEAKAEPVPRMLTLKRCG